MLTTMGCICTVCVCVMRISLHAVRQKLSGPYLTIAPSEFMRPGSSIWSLSLGRPRTDPFAERLLGLNSPLFETMLEIGKH